MSWACFKSINEGFGFGNDPAITCVDMTIHAPEHNKPQVLFSTYENPTMNDNQMRRKYQPNAPQTWEQVAMGRIIVSNWDKIMNHDLIEMDLNFETHDVTFQIKKQWKWEKKK